MTTKLKLHKSEEIDDGELHIHIKHGDDLHFDTDLINNLPQLTFDPRDKHNHKWEVALTPDGLGLEWNAIPKENLFTAGTIQSLVDTTGDFNLYAKSDDGYFVFEIARTNSKGKPHLQAVSMKRFTPCSTAVPEAGTSILLGLGLLLAFFRRSR